MILRLEHSRNKLRKFVVAFIAPEAALQDSILGSLESRAGEQAALYGSPSPSTARRCSHSLAGISQAQNSEPGYGQGAAGHGKRYGAAFADGTIEISWWEPFSPHCCGKIHASTSPAQGRFAPYRLRHKQNFCHAHGLHLQLPPTGGSDSAEYRKCMGDGGWL
jgi:hypothetical protein